MKEALEFDIVITTNNRPKSVETLIQQILNNHYLPNKIIIVDSSKDKNKTILKYEKVYYIHSSHANQPYQRYVGYLSAKSPLLIYLDDDMEIADNNVFEKILNRFNENSIVGLAINFINDNEFLHTKMPKSKFNSTNKSKTFNLLKHISGQVQLNEGKYWYNGLKGKQPKNGGSTEWFSGGAFAVKRKSMYKNFNFKLFDLYENNLGKGEDGIIGFTLSKVGKLEFEPQILFIHNDKKDSIYTKNFFSFSRRVIYSRLFLSYEFCRLNERGLQGATFLYHWYVLWRIVGLLLNQLINFKNERKEILRGYLSGWKEAWKDQKKLQEYKMNDYWKKEALHDITQ